MTTASKDGSWQDPLDVRRARHAPGLLRPFNDAGVLGVADVQVAVGLGRLVPEPDEQVLLAAALAVRALRLGSVCVDLAQVRHTVTVDLAEPTDVQALPWPEVTGWLQACAASAAVAFAPDAAIPDPAIPDPAIPDAAIPDAAIPDAIAARADPPETRTARPLRLAGTRLYLDRYFREEESVAINVLERSCRPGPAVDVGALRSGLARLFPGSGPDGQRLAAAVAALRWLTVLAGGPGTGKTTTIARMLALLCAQPGEPPRIALAAPTGKAAARLEEAIRDALARLSPEDRARLGELRASTLHRLLGARPDTRTRFRHDRHNRLPHDVVVVDETSMVSLSLMDRLLDAVRPGARLVLVGDPDQLASVEAGAVLGDVIGPDAVSPRRSAAMRARVEEMAPGDLTAEDGWPAAEPPGLPAPPDQPRPTLSVGDGVVLLRRTWRFGGHIAELAAAVQRGLADQALDLLAAAADDVSFIEISDEAEPFSERHAGARTAALHPLRDDVVASALPLVTAALAGDATEAVRHLDAHRLLCAHRHGPYGVSRWAALVQHWIGAELPGYGADGEWYAGRPLLVTENDYDLKLYNGDVGVVVAAPHGPAQGALVAAFARGGAPVLVHPARLSAVQTLHAMTVHRSQGSQFERVSVLLPPASSPLLTRELLYTAVTRARAHVRVIGSKDAVRTAVSRPVARATGLGDRLRG